MVWVEPEHLTFTSGESVAFFLHERHEVPGDVGVTLALKFFLPVVVACGAPEALFVKILEGLLLEIAKVGEVVAPNSISAPTQTAAACTGEAGLRGEGVASVGVRGCGWSY